MHFRFLPFNFLMRDTRERERERERERVHLEWEDGAVVPDYVDTSSSEHSVQVR